MCPQTLQFRIRFLVILELLDAHDTPETLCETILTRPRVFGVGFAQLRIRHRPQRLDDTPEARDTPHNLRHLATALGSPANLTREELMVSMDVKLFRGQHALLLILRQLPELCHSGRPRQQNAPENEQQSPRVFLDNLILYTLILEVNREHRVFLHKFARIFRNHLSRRVDNTN